MYYACTFIVTKYGYSGNELPLSVMHVHLSVSTGLAELCRQLGRLDEGSVGHFLTLRIQHYHMRTRIVSGMQPKIVGACYPKRQVIVVLCCAAYQNFIPVGGKVAASAGHLLCFLFRW